MKSRYTKGISQLGIAIAVISLLVQPANAEAGAKGITTNAAKLLTQQNSVSIVKITNVRIAATKTGVEIVLETPQGKALQPVPLTLGRSYIANIPNALLALPQAQEFRQDNPGGGIAQVSVTQATANSIRVTVTGVASAPKVELYDSPNEGLVFSLAPAESQPQPQQPTAGGDEEREIVVTGEQEGYLVPETSAGTRTDTPTRDVPFSIQVVPQRVLQEQKVQRLNDALRNVPGVQSDQPDRSIFEAPRIRGFGGFDSSVNILVNGLRDSGGAIGVGNIDRVEVLRGPAAALFGQGGPGGTINVVTKQPLSTPLYNVEASYGSFDTYTGAIDLGGPLDDKKNVLYRFNAYYFNSNTFVDFFDIERYSFSPTVSIRLGKNTQLILEGEYNVFEQPNNRGLPARGTVLPNPNGRLPRNRFLGEPSVDYVAALSTRIGYRFEHRLDENWQVRNAFRFLLTRQPQNSVFPTLLQEDDRTLERGVIFAREQETESYLLNTDMVGNFTTGSINHQLLVGFDLYTSTNDIGVRTERSLNPVDIFNPVYGSRSDVGPIIDVFPAEKTITDQYGIYIQDRIALSDNLKILLGGRFDWIDQRSKDDTDEVTDSQNDDGFSPRVGIVYQPVPPISLYASYSRSLQQVVGQAFDDSLFQPERGTQYEIGVKADLSDRLAATLALFDITRTNVLTDDPDNPDFQIQTGEQQSRGIEFDITGEILPGWNIIAGYAHTDAEISEDETYEIGNRINNVPRNAFNIWTTYEIQTGSLQGLGFGLGLFYVGEREGDLDNSFRLPDYLRTDAAIYYEKEQFRAALNIRNLFDIRYFDSSENDDLRVNFGDPFTVLGTLSWQF